MEIYKCEGRNLLIRENKTDINKGMYYLLLYRCKKMVFDRKQNFSGGTSNSNLY